MNQSVRSRTKGVRTYRYIAMKKIFISAGLLAAGTACFQEAAAATLDVISPKAWNVSATLRGFYDDNYTVSNTKKGSFGLEFSPEISFNIPLRQTDIGIRYIYGLYYYEQRDELNLDPIDQTHQFDLWLDHSFNERWKIKLTDSVAIGQEPSLIGPTSPTTPNPVQFRVEGDNLANHADISLNTDWTRLLSTSLHYGNGYYDYQNSGTTIPDLIGGKSASLAGLLNRDEESASLDLQWHVQPETMAFIGYQFSWVNYLGNEPISATAFNPFTFPHFNDPSGYFIYRSQDRDSVTHYGYVGAEHEFTANLSGTAKVGASFTDSYNDPLYPSTSVSPYADVNVSYTYIPGSYVQLGFTHDINSTDVAQTDSSGHLTQYQESSVLYADISHHFTPMLLGTLVGRYQYSTYEGGASSAGGDTSYGLGLNLNYQFTRHFSAQAGYNFDDLVSGLDGRAYVRNRFYIGVGANY
jgi:hypothetical protein